MVESRAGHLPDASVRARHGGYFLWANLPEGVDAEKLVALGIKYGVEASSGRLCYPNKVMSSSLRFAYSYVDPEVIRDGIRRLGEAYREYKAAA